MQGSNDQSCLSLSLTLSLDSLIFTISIHNLSHYLHSINLSAFSFFQLQLFWTLYPVARVTFLKMQIGPYSLLLDNLLQFYFNNEIQNFKIRFKHTIYGLHMTFLVLTLTIIPHGASTLVKLGLSSLLGPISTVLLIILRWLEWLHLSSPSSQEYPSPSRSKSNTNNPQLEFSSKRLCKVVVITYHFVSNQ